MPVAVVMEEPERKELKTLPGGYVLLKRLSYGEKLEKRKFNSKMEMEIDKGSRTAKSILDIFNEASELFDFAHCIVEHNLTKFVHKVTGQPVKASDPEGIELPLDFLKPSDVRMLPGHISEEIGALMDALNNFEEDEEVKN